MDESELSCKCLNNSDIIEFSIDVTYKIIKYYLNNKNIIITELKELLKPEYDNKNNIIKPGFNDVDNVIKLINNNNFEMFKNNYKNIHQNMGSIYTLTRNPKYIYMILKDKQNKEFLEIFSKLFCLKDTSYEDLDDYFSDNLSNMYVILDIFGYALGDDSLYRSNMANSIYIRERCKRDMIESVNKSCHIFDLEKTNIKKGNSYYCINNNNLYSQILNKYKKEYLAGPSGSVVLFYNFLFKIFNYDNNERNKALFLGWCISDYVPYFHSLTEVLMSFSKDINKKYYLICYLHQI